MSGEELQRTSFEEISATQEEVSATMEKVVIENDLARLTPRQRIIYYWKVCKGLGLNPWTRPFGYLELSSGGGGKVLQLYCNKGGKEQLRKQNGISIGTPVRVEIDPTVYAVQVDGNDGAGRTDSAIGVVPLERQKTRWDNSTGKSVRVYDANREPVIEKLTGKDLANAIMTAETKAKGRLTLSLSGLGMLDETEIATIDGAKIVSVNTQTGEIVDEEPKTKQRSLPRPSLVDAEPEPPPQEVAHPVAPEPPHVPAPLTAAAAPAPSARPSRRKAEAAPGTLTQVAVPPIPPPAKVQPPPTFPKLAPTENYDPATGRTHQITYNGQPIKTAGIEAETCAALSAVRTQWKERWGEDPTREFVAARFPGRRTTTDFTEEQGQAVLALMKGIVQADGACDAFDKAKGRDGAALEVLKAEYVGATNLGELAVQELRDFIAMLAEDLAAGAAKK